MNKILKHLSKNYLGYIVLICGLLGSYAAFSLILSKIQIYKNPSYVPPCNVNVWLDCGRVMRTKWSELFGFPNMIIGLMTYPLAFLSGLAMITNEKNSKFLSRFFVLVSGMGMLMNITLLYISAYLISALCPWCILAGVATSNVFFATLNYSINNNSISLGKKLDSLIRSGWMFVGVLFYYILMFVFVFLAFEIRKRGISTSQFPDPAFWL
jgi:uncharacterized membrane protein